MSEIDDKEKVERRGTKDRLGRRKELEDIAFVLSSAQGRRFYWRILKRCGIFESSVKSFGTNSTFYYEGERNIGLLLLADLEEADPSAYVKCITEAKTEETKNA